VLTRADCRGSEYGTFVEGGQPQVGWNLRPPEQDGGDCPDERRDG